MSKHHSYDEKLKYMKLLDEGYPIRQLSRDFNISRTLYEHHKGQYGYKRVALQLRDKGFPINHKTVQRLMADMGLKAKIKRAKFGLYKGEIGRVATNVIARDFKSLSHIGYKQR